MRGISNFVIASAFIALFGIVADCHHLDILKHQQTGNPSDVKNSNGNPSPEVKNQRKPRLSRVSQWSQTENTEQKFMKIGGNNIIQNLKQRSSDVVKQNKIGNNAGNRNSPQSSQNRRNFNSIRNLLRSTSSRGFSNINQMPQVRSSFGLMTAGQGNNQKQPQFKPLSGALSPQTVQQVRKPQIGTSRSMTQQAQINQINQPQMGSMTSRRNQLNLQKNGQTSGQVPQNSQGNQNKLLNNNRFLQQNQFQMNNGKSIQNTPMFKFPTQTSTQGQGQGQMLQMPSQTKVNNNNLEVLRQNILQSLMNQKNPNFNLQNMINNHLSKLNGNQIIGTQGNGNQGNNNHRNNNLGNGNQGNGNQNNNNNNKKKGQTTAQIRVSVTRKTEKKPAAGPSLRRIIPSSSDVGQQGNSFVNTIKNGQRPAVVANPMQAFNTGNQNMNKIPAVKLPSLDLSSLLTGESSNPKPNMLLANALSSLPLDVIQGHTQSGMGTSNADVISKAPTATTTGNVNTVGTNPVKIITKSIADAAVKTSASNAKTTGSGVVQGTSGSSSKDNKMSLTLIPSHPGARPIVIKSAGNILVSQYKDAKGNTQYVIKTQHKNKPATTTFNPLTEEYEYEGEEFTTTTAQTTVSGAVM